MFLRNTLFLVNATSSCKTFIEVTGCRVYFAYCMKSAKFKVCSTRRPSRDKGGASPRFRGCNGETIPFLGGPPVYL